MRSLGWRHFIKWWCLIQTTILPKKLTIIIFKSVRRWDTSLQSLNWLCKWSPAPLFKFLSQGHESLKNNSMVHRSRSKKLRTPWKITTQVSYREKCRTSFSRLRRPSQKSSQSGWSSKKKKKRNPRFAHVKFLWLTSAAVPLRTSRASKDWTWTLMKSTNFRNRSSRRSKSCTRQARARGSPKR